MSVYQPMDITCRCGHSFPTKVVHGVNIDRLPDVRDAILDGSFHTTLCPACGTHSVIEKEFLYSDFGRGTFFKVKPRSARHLWEEASRELDDDLAKVPTEVSPDRGRQRRVVFGLGELREKLVAQDAGIDDRLIELMKVLLTYEHPFLLQKPRLRITLDRIGTDRLSFVAEHDHDAERFELVMPRGVFDDIAERQDALAAWIGRSHERSNIFELRNDHWVNMWRWSPQTTALRDLERFAEQARTGGDIDLDGRPVQRMLTYLPRGSHLPRWAKQALRDIYNYAKAEDHAGVMDRTFEIRFAMDLDDDWALNDDPDDLDTLWDLLRDLPDTNVEGNTFISALQLEDGGGGWYSPGSHVIAIGANELFSQEGFQDVVRHEVGHAVQEQRDRNNNNQVSEWLSNEFGWVMLNGSDVGIDTWVDMMGGYADMSSAAIRQVRQVLRLALGSGEEWTAPNLPFLPADHPWRTPGFGPRKAVQQTGSYWYRNHRNWHRHRGRAFCVNYYYKAFMAVNESTLDLIAEMPSSYAAMSPYEFFAELYALYYDLDDPKRISIPTSVVNWIRETIGEPSA